MIVKTGCGTDGAQHSTSPTSNCCRYADVAAGLGLLVSQCCLVWGARAGGRIHQVKITMKIVKTVKMMTTRA